MWGEAQRGTRRKNANRKHMMENLFQLQEEKEHFSLVQIGCGQENKFHQTEL